MKFNITLIISLLLIGSLRAQAQLSCENAWEIPSQISDDIVMSRLHLKPMSDSQEIEQKSHPKFYLTLAKLLNMLGQTKNENFNEKMAMEKGELYLAHILPEGNSLEFSYKIDRREQKPVFRLEEINYVKKNGVAVRVTKESLLEDGATLKEDHVIVIGKQKEIDDKIFLTDQVALNKKNFKDWLQENSLPPPPKIKFDQDMVEWAKQLSESDRLKIIKLIEDPNVIEVPTVIQGALMKELIDWAERIEQLEHSDLRAVESKMDVWKLKAKGEALVQYEYVKNIIRKQAFKLVLLAIATYAVTQFSSEEDEKTENKLDKIKKKVKALEKTNEVEMAPKEKDTSEKNKDKDKTKEKDTNKNIPLKILQPA